MAAPRWRGQNSLIWARPSLQRRAAADVQNGGSARDYLRASRGLALPVMGPTREWLSVCLFIGALRVNFRSCRGQGRALRARREIAAGQIFIVAGQRATAAYHERNLDVADCQLMRLAERRIAKSAGPLLRRNPWHRGDESSGEHGAPS
jgi:hypothetical protein